MNHYKKSALLERIEIQKEELRVIEEKNTKSREEAKSQLKIRLDEFMAKLTPKFISKFNEDYIERLVKERKQEESRHLYVYGWGWTQLKEKTKYKQKTLKDIVAIKKINPLKIVDGRLVYCHAASTGEDHKLILLKNTFSFCLQDNGIEWVGGETQWMGIPQIRIDNYRAILDGLSVQLNCIDEDLIELETMSNKKNIFKEINMNDEACTIKE